MRAKEIKHEGRWKGRLQKGNPREDAFAEQWRHENEERQISMSDVACTLDFLLERKVEQSTAKDVATVIQWLGSNVGFDFLRCAIERCGLRIVEGKPAKNV